MLKIPRDTHKLVPLRRFAFDGLYNTAYLSQLVQRGKLKAQKIGRNYCTSREWFLEYLEIHALDETREAYLELFIAVDKKAKQTELEIEQVSTTVKLPTIKLNRLVLKRAMISVIALFVLLSGSYFISKYIDQKGDVAGVEEKGIEVDIDSATTSQETIKIDTR